VLLDQRESPRVAVTVRGDRRFEHDHPTDHVHDRERVRVAVRIYTDHEVQLICKHP
jgi:hypothetical protein